MQRTIAGRTIRGLVPGLADDPQLAEDFVSTLVDLRRREMTRVAQRGVTRGDLDPATPLELISELLIAPLFWRLLLTGESLDEPVAQRLVDAALHGLAARHDRVPGA